MKYIYWLLGGGTLYLAITVIEHNPNAAITLALVSILWFLTALKLTLTQNKA